MSQWIGSGYDVGEYSVGQVGFLVERFNENTGQSTYSLRDQPPHTNRSHEPRLHGWCGSYNNIATNGCGMARVARVARNGRAMVVSLRGSELRAALDEIGYPELIPE